MADDKSDASAARPSGGIYPQDAKRANGDGGVAGVVPGKDSPDIVALPPLLMLGAVIASAMLNFIWPLDLLPPPPNPWVTATAIGLGVIGFALAIWGALTFRKAETNIDPREPSLVLVSSGPYRFTRNPMYVGLLFALPAIGLLLSVEWSVPMVAPLWAALHWGVVLREEAYLEAKFGQPYRDYLARTRRWI